MGSNTLPMGWAQPALRAAPVATGTETVPDWNSTRVGTGKTSVT